MNKILVAIFNDEESAYEGLSALKDLHRDHDISIYSTAVISKAADGTISVKQVADEGARGTWLGILSGSLVGLLAGPIGVMVGASLGGLTGSLFDLRKAGVDIDFAEEVANEFPPGKTAVLADIEESWTAPVDTRLQKFGAIIFRRLRSEVAEDQFAREAAADEAELRELKEEWKAANEETKVEIQKRIDAIKNKLNAAADQVDQRLQSVQSDVTAKVEALQQQMTDASDARKAKLEKQIAALKADQASRSEKLNKAGSLIKEALTY